MARYDFRCSGCGQTVELAVSTAETHLVADEDGEHDCGPLRRIFTAPAVVWPTAERGH